MQLSDQPKTLITDYSHGMQKKLAMAAAVIHGPKVLFLDEPFEGVDAVASGTLKSMLQRMTSHAGVFLTDLKLDDATIVAALLHDTIEDTEATRAEIDQLFGKDIGHLVEGLTKLKKLDLVSREAKQAENLRKLLLAIAEDVRVLLVKLADRLHNMRTLQYMSPEARKRVSEETIDIYAPLAARIGMYEMREELEDLSFRMLDPEAYEVVKHRLEALAERNRNLIGEIESQLSKNLRKNGLTAHV